MTIAPARRGGNTVARVALIGAIGLLLAIYARLWLGLLALPALGGVDFVSFYTAGRIARAGEYQRLYELAAQHAVQMPIVGPDFVPGGTLLYLRLPILAPVLGLIAVDDYRSAYLAWAVLLALALAACGAIVFRLLRDQGWERADATLMAASGVLFYPIFLSFLAGQDSIFVLLAALLWVWALLTGRERLAGLALGLTIVKPQIALALGLPLLASRRRAGGWFCVSAAALLLFSFALVGWQGLADFVNLLRLSSDGQGYGSNHLAMYNLIGLTRRSFPLLDGRFARGLGWAAFGLAIGGACWLWWGKGAKISAPQLGLPIVAIVFALPHLYVHDLSLLLLPILCLSLAVMAGHPNRRLLGPAILVASSLLLLASMVIKGTLPYVVGYVLMLGLGVGLAALSFPRANFGPAGAATGASATRRR